MKLRAKLFVVAGAMAAAAALFTGTALADTPAATSAPSVAPLAVAPLATTIPVPPDYIYNPSLGSLHDYCTDSPDSWFSADFRGPCARHDMCYEAPGDHKAACDAELRDGITNNCVAAYPTHPDACAAAGYTYYAAVVAFGDDPAVITKSTTRPATSEQQDIARYRQQT